MWLPCRVCSARQTRPGCKLPQLCPCYCGAVVPPGYYLKSPGQVAPCPQGEWKADIGASANCTKCAAGVTTPQVASTSEAECKCECDRACCAALPGRVACTPAPYPSRLSPRALLLCACTHVMDWTESHGLPRSALPSDPFPAVLLPGYVALEMSPEGAILKASLCPQKYW